jgi:hypothetical protein
VFNHCADSGADESTASAIPATMFNATLRSHAQIIFLTIRRIALVTQLRAPARRAVLNARRR